MSILAIIPARGGSKRLKNKNLRLFRGKPLVTWAIEQAKASKLITRIVVSSDSPKILKLAGPYALKRPPYLSQDSSTSEACIVHALYSLPLPHLFILLQPTSPLRTSEDIDACLKIALEHGSCNSSSSHTPNGACYAHHSKTFLSSLSLHSPFLYPMSHSLDINTEEDLNSEN